MMVNQQGRWFDNSSVTTETLILISFLTSRHLVQEHNKHFEVGHRAKQGMCSKWFKLFPQLKELTKGWSDSLEHG